MLSVPWVRQHPKGGVRHMLIGKPFSLPRLQDVQPQEGHLLKLNFLALLPVWLFLNHQKRSQPEFPPPYQKGARVDFFVLVFIPNCSLAFDWLPSVKWLSDSSCGTLEFHLCNSKPAALKTYIAVPFNSCTWSWSALFLPKRWCHQHKDLFFLPHALGFQFLKLLKVVSRSLEEETATEQVQIKPAWTLKSQLAMCLYLLSNEIETCDDLLL